MHRFIVVAAVLLWVAGAGADTLTVNGTISDPDQNPIEGASVTLSIAVPGAGIDSVTGTTDTAGAFELTIDNATGERFATLAASATDYNDGQANVNVRNADDGTPDTVTRDMQLQPIIYDTTTVTATVDDGAAAIADARVILSYLNEVDTVLTDASGQIAFEIIGTQPVGNVGWVVEADGYASETGNAQVAAGVADLGTISLTAFTTADTLTYTVSGSVTDAQGGGLRGETVIVTYESGTTVLAIDTVQSAGGKGNYNSQVLLPYQAGDLTVTVEVAAAGFAPFSESVTVPMSTVDIVVDAALDPEVGIAFGTAAARTQVRPDRAAVYTLGGRCVAELTGGIDANLLERFRQPLVVRWFAGQTAVGSQVFVPAR
jgi:hypothetical protein